MKTKLVLLFIFIIGIANVNAQTPNEINYFSGSYEDALKESAKEAKPIFLIGHTTWCGYCKKLKRTTLTETEVVEILNKNYIVLSVDMEKDNGPELRKKYEITGYPTMLILKSDGSLSKKIIGFHKAPDLLRKLK